MLVANKAVGFWTARAARCPIDHQLPQIEHIVPTINKEQFAQAYLLLWVCAESHYSPEYDARVRKLGPELLDRELRLLREIYEFTSFDLDRPTKLSTGSADPDEDDSDIEPEEVWFRLTAGGVRLEHNLESVTNSHEWCFWEPSYRNSWSGLYVRDGISTEWDGEKPIKCYCPKATWLKWDLVQMDWWHTWDRTV